MAMWKGRQWLRKGKMLVSKVKHEKVTLAPTLEFYAADDCIYTNFGNRPVGEKVAHTEEVYPGICIDFRADGTPCGIDVFAIVKRVECLGPPQCDGGDLVGVKHIAECPMFKG